MPNSAIAMKPLALSLVRQSTTLAPDLATASAEVYRGYYKMARTAIERKFAEIGGATGSPVAEVEMAAGPSFQFLRRFQNGAIYWSESTGARWVYGAILEKFKALGAGGGFLGYPTTDTSPTADGVGRYTHFERGSIHWSPATGAHEVHGAILARWQALGWELSWLGYPVTDEVAFPEDGRVSVFQNGSIYWWADAGTRELNDIVLQYTGLYCFGETDVDGGSDADEPYASISVNGPEFETTMRTQIYEDVDSGDERPDIVEIYRGKPRGALISAVLNEYSGGDTDLSRDKLKEAYDEASPYVAAAATSIPVIGPVLGPVSKYMLDVAREKILESLNAFLESTLGYANRPLGADVIGLSAKEMVLLATRPEAHAFQYGIPWRLETKLLERFGASYKLYFNIFAA